MHLAGGAYAQAGR